MKYYLIAGEASGDLHGANLMREIAMRDVHAEFRIWGGDAMSKLGGTPVRHIRDLAIMGFVEVVVHMHTVLGNIRFCKQDILQFKPDVVVGIDYPGFNFKIESWAHNKGFRTVHYISPNLWAWKAGRIKKMRRVEDLLCYILPFEKQFFAKHNMPQAKYVGHPLLDAIQFFRPVESEESESRPMIALLPGSRRQELINSMPLMIRLAIQHPEYRFVVAGMSLLGAEKYHRMIPEGSNIEVVYDQTYQVLSRAFAAIVCSGTATLETALFNVPQVVCYRANPISIAIAKSIVSRRIKFISLVNLIADAPIVTELIQQDFNLPRLESEFNRITKDSVNRQRMQSQYAEMRKILGDGGASARTAQAIIELVQ